MQLLSRVVCFLSIALLNSAVAGNVDRSEAAIIYPSYRQRKFLQREGRQAQLWVTEGVPGVAIAPDTCRLRQLMRLRASSFVLFCCCCCCCCRLERHLNIGGGDRTRTCKGFRPAVFKTASLPLGYPSSNLSTEEYNRCRSAISRFAHFKRRSGPLLQPERRYPAFDETLRCD